MEPLRFVWALAALLACASGRVCVCVWNSLTAPRSERESANEWGEWEVRQVTQERTECFLGWLKARSVFTAPPLSSLPSPLCTLQLCQLVCVHECVHMCKYVCVCVCVRACVTEWACYGNVCHASAGMQNNWERALAVVWVDLPD